MVVVAKDEMLAQASTPNVESVARLQVEADESAPAADAHHRNSIRGVKMGLGLACFALLGLFGRAALPSTPHAEAPVANAAGAGFHTLSARPSTGDLRSSSLNALERNTDGPMRMPTLDGKPRRSGFLPKLASRRDVVAGVTAASLLLTSQVANAESAPSFSAEQDLVFPWMGWSPEVETKLYKTLQTEFPGAIPGTALHERTKQVLGMFGLNSQNTIFGTSICSDEINNMKGDMAHTMEDYWGEVFPLGGLGGVGFTGKTGFGAFSHHVPQDGNIVILFGPHIGISSSGEIGKTLRQGQLKESGACGAVLGAYGQCKDGNCNQNHDDLEFDMQQAYIRNKLAPHIQRIQQEPVPLSALTQQAYKMVEESVVNIVDNDFGSGNLVLIGGIQINMPDGLEDHFQPKMFKVMRKGKPTVDLMRSLDIPVQTFELRRGLATPAKPATPPASMMTASSEVPDATLVRGDDGSWIQLDQSNI